MNAHSNNKTPAKPKILYVDDEKNVLSSFRKLFRDDYRIVTAEDPKEGLVALLQKGPFEVVVSDLIMPLMNGVSFFTRVKELSPETVRILVTGYADFDNAVLAVNQGHVFRFLSKPCPPDVLKKAIDDAVEQHEMILARQELHSLKKVQALMNGIVEGFSAIVEARDPYTSGHQRRVAEIAVRIGKRMGYDPDRLDALRIAGMIHDVGKVYIPLDFLNKPGLLKQEEMSIIHLHPEVGADIFKNLEYDWPISEFIHQHHERLDGSGYPAGLPGDEILPEARILAVADVIDAMNSRRPYRDSLGLTAAKEELVAHSGTKYDPEVVDQALAVLRDNPPPMPEEPATRPGDPGPEVSASRGSG